MLSLETANCKLRLCSSVPALAYLLLQFRNMWAEFEWENKVSVNTTITDVNQFLQHIIATTNMKCLTPPSALEGEMPRTACTCAGAM